MTYKEMSPEVLLKEAAFCGESAAMQLSVDPSMAARFAASAWRFAERYAATGAAIHVPKRSVDWRAVRRGRMV